MNLEPKYALFDSVDQMLTPETLSELLTKPVTRVDSRTINEHAGMAGGQLSYIDTDAGRFVLKRMFINSDWVMSTTNDRCCRAVKLWQYGLLDQLLPHLEHKIIACSQDGDGWAILMEDLTGHVFTWNTPLTTELVYLFLDRLARIHATFWNEPCLPEASLGLCTPTQLIEAISLSHAQTYNHLSMGLLPEWIRDGWEVMEAKLDSDVYTHMRNLSEHPQPLVKALSRYPYTLLHGDYRAENLAHSENPVALDWQGAAYSLMTIDLAWFVDGRHVWDTMGKKLAIHYYRERLEFYLDMRFDDAEWQIMTELGDLIHALRFTFIYAYWYKHTEDPVERQINERELMERNQQVRNGVRWI